jgi:hypothetical protein
MGDDTWQQLLPEAFTESHPYPSFTVKDLHTVDDGVWEVRCPLPGLCPTKPLNQRNISVFAYH